MASRLVSVRRMAGASVANVAYFVIQSLMFLVLTPWALRALGDELYGLWTVMLAVAGFASLGGFGTAPAALKYTAEFSVPDDDGHRFSAAITFSYGFVSLTSVLTCLAVLVLRHRVAAQIISGAATSALLADALGLIAVGLVPLLLSLVSRGVLLGLVRNELATILDLVHLALLWIGAIAIGLGGGGVLQLGLWSLVTNSLRFLCTTYAAWRVARPFSLRPAWDKALTRRILRYSFLSWIGSLGVLMFQTLDRVSVGITLGPVAAGAYGIATGVALRFSMLASQVTQVLVPLASSYQAARRESQIRSAFRHTSRLTACVLVAAVSLLVIWMDVILATWISPQFSELYSHLFRVLVICYAVYNMATPAYQILLGLGWLGVPMAIIVGSGLCVLVALWTLTQGLGMNGAAYANSVYMLVLSISLYSARRLGLNPLATVLEDLGPPLLVLLVAVALPASSLPLAARLASNLAMWAALSWLALGGNRLKLLLKAIRRSESST